MLGVKIKLQEECAFSITEKHFSRSEMGFDYDAGIGLGSVSCLYQVDSLSRRIDQARLGCLCKTISGTVRAHGSCDLINMRPLQW